MMSQQERWFSLSGALAAALAIRAANGTEDELALCTSALLHLERDIEGALEPERVSQCKCTKL
jgi:hypothetical protein